MKEDKDVVLQQRIRARTIGDSGFSRCKRIRRTDRQQEKEERCYEHRGKRTRHQGIGDLSSIPPRHPCRHQCEREQPHENRPFERTPHRREVVQRRSRPGPDLLDVIEREVASDHRVFHGHEGPNCRHSRQCGEPQ